jgi:hypothetical protein
MSARLLQIFQDFANLWQLIGKAMQNFLNTPEFQNLLLAYEDEESITAEESFTLGVQAGVRQMQLER